MQQEGKRLRQGARTLNDLVAIKLSARAEVGKILEQLADFDLEKLDESARIRVYETVKVNIVDPNAVVILRKNTSRGGSLVI